MRETRLAQTARYHVLHLVFGNGEIIYAPLAYLNIANLKLLVCYLPTPNSPNGNACAYAFGKRDTKPYSPLP